MEHTLLVSLLTQKQSNAAHERIILDSFHSRFRVERCIFGEPAMKICSAIGCSRKHQAKGFCQKHYRRLSEHGDHAFVDERRRSLEERFWLKVAKTDSCWLWFGKKSIWGYGRLNSSGKRVAAHRVSYEIHKGRIPDGLTIDHLCRVRLCVNPSHLEAVTSKVNLLRGEGACAKNARKTHCIRGHEYTHENTDNRHEGRRCRTCRVDRDRRKRQHE